MKLTKEEEKQQQIDIQLIAYEKATKKSSFPFRFMWIIAGLNFIVWLLHSYYANPSAIKPMYDGLGSVLGKHILYAVNQTFFYGILPYLLLYLIIALFYKLMKLPSEPMVKQKLSYGDNVLEEITNILKQKVLYQRVFIFVLFLGLSVITIMNVSFKLEEIQIYEAKDLMGLTDEDRNKRIVLMNDIELERPYYYYESIFDEFRGVFDGQGYRIINGNDSDSKYRTDSSMFGTNYGIIANVHFEGIHSYGGKNVSVVATYNHGTISNVSVNNATLTQISAYNTSDTRFAVFATLNTGVIENVSYNNVLYEVEESLTTDVDIHMSGITVGNQGLLENINATTYYINYVGDDNPPIVYGAIYGVDHQCLVSCPINPNINYNVWSLGLDEGVIEDALVQNGQPEVYLDDFYTSCISCVTDFSLQSNYFDTPITYPDITIKYRQ